MTPEELDVKIDDVLQSFYDREIGRSAARDRIRELFTRNDPERLTVASRLMAAQRLSPKMALESADALIAADRESGT